LDDLEDEGTLLSKREKLIIEYVLPLTDGYKLWNYSSLMCTHQFIVRRTLLLLSCFFMNGYPFIQAMIYI